MCEKPIFDFDTTCFTTYTKATTPIVCAAPTPSCSPKRKYSCDDNTNYNHSNNNNYNIKRRRMSTNNDDAVITPTTPLYRNFGNGLSLCNNTKTNRLSTLDEILQFLTREDSIKNYRNNDTTTTRTTDTMATKTSTKCTDIEEESVSDDIVNELLIELSCKNELPELNALLDLKDVFHTDLDFIL